MERVKLFLSELKHPYWKLVVAGLFNAFCSSFQVGFYLSAVNIPEEILENFTNLSFYDHYDISLDTVDLSSVWAFVVTTYFIGSIIGCLLTKEFAERLGRKNSIMIWNNLIALVGAILQGCAKSAKSFELIIAGRFVIGIATGISVGVLSVYLTECSPKEWRGFIGSFLNMFVTSTSLFGTAFSLPQVLGSDTLWPVLLSLGVIPAILQMIATPFVYETPKFIYVRTKDRALTEQAIRFYHGPGANIDEVIHEYDMEEKLAAKQVGFVEALSDFNLRWPIIISSTAMVAAGFTGILAIFSYSTKIFEKVNLGKEFSQYATVIMSCCNTMGSFVGLVLMEKLQRRTLFLGGIVVCVALNIAFLVFSQVLSQTGDQYAAWVCLSLLLTFVFVYNVGPGAIAWFLSSELTPQSARSVGAAITTTIGHGLTTLLTTLVYPIIDTKYGSWSFLYFIIPTSICVVFLWFKMPETKGKTIEEVMLTWYRKPKGEQNDTEESQTSNF